MALHLRKLCVGIDSVEQLERAQARRLKHNGALRHDSTTPVKSPLHRVRTLTNP